MRFVQSTTRLQTIVLSVVALLLTFAFSLPVAAQNNSAIAQQFHTLDSDITPASLVTMQQAKTNTIELSTLEHADRLVGVVSDKPLIQLSAGESGVQVVTNGLVKTLVSDVNGAIVAGDKITASPIEGVGMKAVEDTTVVGTAQGPMTNKQTRTIKDTAGKDVQVRVGLVTVQVGVSSFTADSNKQSTLIPAALQQVANNLAGQNVSPVRVLVAGLILLLLFACITILLYSAVRSSIISIGRNPLSERAVRKSLVQVAVTVVAVLMFAVALIYIVLRA
jgi:hypothetical protein